MPRFTEIIQDVRPAVVECPERSIEEYGRRAVIELCRRSRFWRETIEVPLEHDQAEYDMPRIRPEGRVEQILVAEFKTDPSGNGSGKERKLGVVQYREIRLPGKSHTRADPVNIGADYGLQKFRVWPVPNVETQLNPRIALHVAAVPTQRARNFPDPVYEQWRDAITDGTLWHLLRMPNKPWTDIELSRYHRSEFYRQVNDATRAQMKDGAQGRTRLRRWV